MSATVHVVGAGVAGLAAALAAAREGSAVRLYEAAPQAGGRCRTVTGQDGFRFDNGTHALLSANRAAFGLIDAFGARDFWMEPEPDGLPMLDAATGDVRRVSLSPAHWIRADRRPPGLKAGDLWRLAAATLPHRDRSVASLFGDRDCYAGFVEPLATAVLNTRAELASARRFGQVLRRLARPGAARLFVARRGLGPDLIEPAQQTLRRLGVSVATGARLRAVVASGGRAVRLDFGAGPAVLGARDRVVLALPPHEAGRLLPSLPVPDRFESIANVHVPLPGPDAPRLVGLSGALSQWALMRAGSTSVTVSAAGDGDLADLAARVWPEIRAARRAAGLETPETAPRSRVVVERRATIRHAVGDPIGFPPTGLENLELCGDWGGPLPATIEAAARSGLSAGRRAGRAAAGRSAGAASAPAGAPA